ncbi:LuxR C-terminal-related transcriptional regulator [Streptomyces sp. NPDC051133]|uniref:LuxR C-terminal-related transcriptional regulator n=1 Tax=Streptomyces sp. NPDC051133 TaxID=3155521 RepID=UPI0034285B91
MKPLVVPGGLGREPVYPGLHSSVDPTEEHEEIGVELFISSKTVEYHRGHIYSRYGFSSRRQFRD